MQRYQDVTAASLNLAMSVRALVKEPGVKLGPLKEYCKLLQKLKDAEDKMLNDFCTEMMHELVPVGVEAFKGMGMEGDLGKCTCGRQERRNH